MIIRCLAIGIDQANHWELNRAFRAYTDQFEILFVENGLEAINNVDFSKIAIIFSEASDSDALKANLKRFLEANQYAIPILQLQSGEEQVSGAASDSTSQNLTISRPVLPGALAGKLLVALGDLHFQGNMTGIDFVSILQLIEMDRLTCTLALASPGQTAQGFVFFRDGKPIDAIYQRAETQKALQQIFSRDDAVITMYNDCPLVADRLQTNCSKMIVDFKGIKPKGETQKKTKTTGLANLFMKVKKKP